MSIGRSVNERSGWVTALLMAVVMLNGCGGQGDEGGSQSSNSSDPGTSKADIVITGAGATFPYPLYSKWASTYHETFGAELNYQSIGSGGGIAQIKARTVDFGASDAPLKPQELDEIGLIQFPMAMGGVVMVVNLEGVTSGQLKLPQDVLVDIFMAKITKWNDPAIAQANPGVSLPDLEITVVHRADGSGTTWIFTNYLSKISEAWKSSVGNAKAVKWPTGVGGKGNEGVAAYVSRIKGAIGYVEFAYALENNMTTAKLRNADGKYVAPTIESFQAAAANADWTKAPGFYMVLTEQPGAESWPITGATFILMYKQQKDASHATDVLKFFDWCYHKGQDAAVALHYVPMPKNVVKLVQDRWTADMAGVGGAKVWPAP
jgi:phosphate transport system substrate-binding protein